MHLAIIVTSLLVSSSTDQSYFARQPVIPRAAPETSTPPPAPKVCTLTIRKRLFTTPDVPSPTFRLTGATRQERLAQGKSFCESQVEIHACTVDVGSGWAAAHTLPASREIADYAVPDAYAGFCS